jgi:methylated-DNA-[protein]-cysteine S-methyltransferase
MSQAALESKEVSTPAGVLAIVIDPATNTVVASGFSSVADQIGRLSSEELARGLQAISASTAMDPIVHSIAAYSDGFLLALDEVAVSQPGGPFRQDAWIALRQVPPGHTATYLQLAALAGRPTAVRAAGSACAQNRVAPFVPCHRVVRTGGGLGGYYYGLSVKEALLRHEGALLLL